MSTYCSERKNSIVIIRDYIRPKYLNHHNERDIILSIFLIKTSNFTK
jgi:hypothetical protein